VIVSFFLSACLGFGTGGVLEETAIQVPAPSLEPGRGAAGQERQTVFVFVLVALVLKSGEKGEHPPDCISGRHIRSSDALTWPFMGGSLSRHFL
jgi:hypothetical protein